MLCDEVFMLSMHGLSAKENIFASKAIVYAVREPGRRLTLPVIDIGSLLFSIDTRKRKHCCTSNLPSFGRY